MRDELTDEHYYTLKEVVLYGGGSILFLLFCMGVFYLMLLIP